MMGARRGATLVAAGLLCAGAAPLPAAAQTAGEGSGAGVVGSGAMIKNPDHAQKGGDSQKPPEKQSKDRKSSDERTSSGGASPSTNPE